MKMGLSQWYEWFHVSLPFSSWRAKSFAVFFFFFLLLCIFISSFIFFPFFGFTMQKHTWSYVLYLWVHWIRFSFNNWSGKQKKKKKKYRPRSNFIHSCHIIDVSVCVHTCCRCPTKTHWTLKKNFKLSRMICACKLWAVNYMSPGHLSFSLLNSKSWKSGERCVIVKEWKYLMPQGFQIYVKPFIFFLFLLLFKKSCEYKEIMSLRKTSQMGKVPHEI